MLLFQTSHYCGLRKKNISSDIYSLDVLSKDLEDEEDTVTVKALKLSNSSTVSLKINYGKTKILLPLYYFIL